MKRLIFILALAGFVVSAGGAAAQYRDDTVLFTLNAGALVAKSNETGGDMTGNTAGFTLEKVLVDGKVSAGISIPFLFAEETISVEGSDPVEVDFSGTPVLLTCKYNFLNGRFAAYVGGGIGIHWSTLKTDAGTSDERSSQSTGMAFSLPVGVAYFLDDDFYIQGNYVLGYMSTTPLRDNMSQAITLGMGFQWGEK